MMPSTDVVVRRCAVRVVRHGGWSWGPQPQRLVDQVIAALPGLIAGHLGGSADDGHGAPDVEITEPVRIVVSLRLPDLLAGRFDPVRQAVISTSSELAAAMARAAGSSVDSRRGPTTVPLRPGEEPAGRSMPSPAPAAAQPVTLVHFLADLFDRGQLDDVLTLLPVSTLEAWYQAVSALLDDRVRLLGLIAATAPDPLPRDGRHLISEVPDLPAAAASATASRAEELRHAIVTVAAWAGRIGAASPGASGAVAAPSSGPARTAAQPATSQQATSGASRPAVSEVDVASALPFLLLGPLALTGYLAALAPVLQGAGLAGETPAFATALAYTVLGPLERGWRRRPDDLISAAAFAGLAEPVPGRGLTEFARAATPVLPALDAVITRILAEGHTPGEPLVLARVEDRAGGGLLLADREGLFPVAWAGSLGRLLPAWRLCGSPPILVAPTAAAALRALATAGAPFVTANQPGRGERWRPLPPYRLWTNDHSDPALTRHASGYREAVQQTAELTEALAADRAAAPLAAGSALGRSLLLAAGLALGTLAWTLWREREPTDPLLALERFADLSALVSFEPHRVRVRLPLGPRHADLYQHGLLADVTGVPWLGGRVVEFSGG